jgi:two-component system chemotaxis sensor kinase CheA
MKIDLSQFRGTFMQESSEHVLTMESGLFELRSAPQDMETLNAIFRSAHSIKGGAGSFGLTQLVRFTHVLESLLDRLRSMEIPVTEEIIGVLLASVDVLRELLGAEDDHEPPENMAPLLERLRGFTAGNAVVASEPKRAGDTTQTTTSATYQVQFSPRREMFSSGTNPLVLLRNLASLGTATPCLQSGELPVLKEIDPEKCYLSWSIDLVTSQPEAAISEVFEFVEHLIDLTIQRCAEDDSSAPKTLALSQTVGKQEAIDLTVLPREVSKLTDADERKTNRRASTSAEASSIRVTTDKVDRLIDLVGELVIAHVMTAQMVDTFTPECLPKLREAVAAMERNTRELHERVMSVRMLPIGSLFQRYTRIVYDIGQSTGKSIRLETSGEETEIDKSMLELLGDPLTHLIRNAADHGIESVEVRRAAGKPDEGLIQLRAFHRASRIVIEISDDGAGIDTRLVRSKAIERGLIAADAQLTDDQLRMLIFEPGFSTREQVSDLSGRGVGMDVVKRNVLQLSGTVMLASELGSGSTVSIELPLTLAILEGLLVRVADRTMVLPLLSVVETLAPEEGRIKRIAEQGEVIVVREESIPIIRLCRFVELQYAPAAVTEPGPAAAGGAAVTHGDEERHLVVVVEVGRRKIGLLVDELLGQQQVVMKSLEKNFHKVPGLMGATILGDGCVAPILDVTSLAEMNLYSLPPGVMNVHPAAAMVGARF